MSDLIEQLLRHLFIIIAFGIVMVMMYRLFRLMTGLFLIGLVAIILFIEVYGLYLLVTDSYLYIDDFIANGVFSFSGFFVICNILLIAGLVLKVFKSRQTY